MIKITDLREIIHLLDKEEISISRACEMLNMLHIAKIETAFSEYQQSLDLMNSWHREKLRGVMEFKTLLK
jgi:hypothetical protein